jgi:LEA14-like dessication related protein
MRPRSLRAPSSFLYLAAALLVLALAGCAGMRYREPVRVNVVDLQPLPGQGLEIRFNVKLRVQNPNETPIDYDGLALELEVNGKPFATGVSDRKGSVPRFGDALIDIPVSVPAVSAVRQVLGLVTDAAPDSLPYVLHGRLGGGPLGAITFTETGTLRLPELGSMAR